MTIKKHIMFISVPLIGHTNQMISLAEELITRGYQVSFVISEKGKEWVQNTGAKFIAWNQIPEKVNSLKDKNSSLTLWDMVSREKNKWRAQKMMYDSVIETYPHMYKTLKPIFEEYKPDLIIVDRAVITAMDLAWQMKIPCIIQSRFLGDFVKTSSNLPGFGTSYSIKMNLWEKLINRILPLFSIPRIIPILLNLNQVRQKCSGCKNLPDLFAKKLIIVGTSFGIEIPRPIPPLVKMVGPILPKTIKPLTPSLKEWLDATKEDTVVIYMAFGTLASLESWQAKALVEGLKDSKFKILWSIPEIQQHILPPLSDSFRIESFVPQQAVLSHRAVRIFISHCGMNSINEALYNGKPILGLPFFGDQFYNIARIVDLGTGIKLNKENLQSREVRQKVNLLLNDPMYRNKANKMSTILKNTRGRELAADIVEDTINVGISHLDPEMIYNHKI